MLRHVHNGPVMAKTAIVIRCREPHCQNVEVLHPDSRIPQSDYICTPCQDAIEEQMTNELAKRAAAQQREGEGL